MEDQNLVANVLVFSVLVNLVLFIWLIIVQAEFADLKQSYKFLLRSSGVGNFSKLLTILSRLYYLSNKKALDYKCALTHVLLNKDIYKDMPFDKVTEYLRKDRKILTRDWDKVTFPITDLKTIDDNEQNLKKLERDIQTYL